MRRACQWHLIQIRSLLMICLLPIPWGGCRGGGEARPTAASDMIDPHPDEVLSWRHQILAREDYERLAREWEAYTKQHPKNARGFVEWGDALRYSDRREEAKEAYARAFRTDSTSAAAIASYASNVFLSDVEKADWKLAYERLLRASTVDPNYAETYYTLWSTSLRNGDRDLTERCLKQLVELGDMPRPLLDYGYNMVAGAPENAIILTNGDNDTYPPLASQALTGLRRDVSIVNLSLLNIRWYIRLMRDSGVPIGLDDSQIDALQPTQDRRISDQVQLALYENLKKSGWPRPLFYAVTVFGSNKVIAGKRILEGLLERFVPGQEGGQKEECDLDLARTRELLDIVYRLDGITDPLVDWKHENAVVRLGKNYVALLTRVGTAMQEKSPREEGGPYLYKAIAILVFHHSLDEARGILNQWEKTDPNSTLLPKARKLIEQGG